MRISEHKKATDKGRILLGAKSLAVSYTLPQKVQ